MFRGGYEIHMLVLYFIAIDPLHYTCPLMNGAGDAGGKLFVCSCCCAGISFQLLGGVLD